MITYKNDCLLKIIEDNFAIDSIFHFINDEVVFDLNDEKINISLKDETKNDYLHFDYMLQFWTLSKDKKHSRGNHIALHKGDDLEKRIINFLDEKVFKGKVFRKGSFTNEWNNTIVITVADDDKKKKDEPLTLFDFI